MCGRFVQVERPEFYAEHFRADFVRSETITPSWNVAPTMNVYAVAQHDGDRVLTSLRWGLVPFWAKDRKIGSRAINARIETAMQKPMFKDSFAKRRCLIPVDGFYEWQKKEKGKLPHFIHSTDGKPLSVAGLWSSWRDPETDERLLTCTILTGEPNSLVRPIHDRMPVVIPEANWDRWLAPGEIDLDVARSLAAVHPSSAMSLHPVSTLVNNVANNSADLLTPLETPAVESP